MKRLPRLLKKHFNNYFIIFLFIAAGFVLYANTLPNQMFWDDNDSILNNQFIQNWHYFPKYFSENIIAGAGLLSDYWRPALLSVFSLEWHLWGSWAPGYHFINTSFHIADAIFLFFILFYIFRNRWLAVLTALVFLVHPLQTEAVTYAAGLGDSLSSFFIFLGILFYLKFLISKKTPFKSPFYFSSILMYALALMSKETAIVMPGFLFIADFFFQPNGRKFILKEKLKGAIKRILPFLALAGIYILLRATVLNFINTFNLYNEKNVFTSNFNIRLFTFFRVLTVYSGLLFWPFNLHMERSVEIAASLFSPSVIFGGFIFLGLLILAFSQLKRLPILSFGILWFFIGLAPTSNLLVPVNGLIYEHWLYLPLIGIFLALIWLGLLAAKKRSIVGRILLGIFIVFLVFLSVLTINRNKDWRNPIVFYNQTLKYAPNNYKVVNNLGMAYADKGDYSMAKEMYRRAVKIDPSVPVAYHNLGNAYKAMGKNDLAVKNFETAIKIDPKFVFSYNALAGIYLKNKNYQEARKVLEKYLGYSDSKVNVLFSLAQIAFKEKDLKGMLSYLEKALKIDPENRIIQENIINIKKLIESGPL